MEVFSPGALAWRQANPGVYCRWSLVCRAHLSKGSEKSEYTFDGYFFDKFFTHTNFPDDFLPLQYLDNFFSLFFNHFCC